MSCGAPVAKCWVSPPRSAVQFIDVCHVCHMHTTYINIYQHIKTIERCKNGYCYPALPHSGNCVGDEMPVTIAMAMRRHATPCDACGAPKSRAVAPGRSWVHVIVEPQDPEAAGVVGCSSDLMAKHAKHAKLAINEPVLDMINVNNHGVSMVCLISTIMMSIILENEPGKNISKMAFPC